MTFVVLILASLSVTAFWNVAPCSVVGKYQHYRAAYWPHLQSESRSC
jgi:hypothetical protein